jgi:hypothetical protein
MTGAPEEGRKQKNGGAAHTVYSAHLLKRLTTDVYRCPGPTRRKFEGMARHFKFSVACQVVPSA